MKFIHLFPLAAVTAAFIIPDEQMTSQIVLESKDRSVSNKLPSKDEVFSGIQDTFNAVKEVSGNLIDNALEAISDAGSSLKASFFCHNSMTAFDVDGWLEYTESMSALDDDIFEHPDKPHRPPHRKPHHGQKPNLTVYELIAQSKYTTKLAKLINEYPDLVETLNSTAANYTVFAPIDKAFEKIPKGHKPSAELLKKVLLYHVSTDFYPARRMLLSHTIPSALDEEALGGEAQRLRVGVSLRGITVNFYSKVVAVNIFGTNGVIHGVESLLLPPPPALKIIDLLPGQFSTLNLALKKTGLFETIKHSPHEGGTLFAPTNTAFAKLGPKINAFLFSKYGEKYLKALLKYHIVANQTLYSDAFYRQKYVESSGFNDVSLKGVPRGHFHVDLPTLLEGKNLSIDVSRYGRFISIKINGFNHVAIPDGIAKDGVIHVLTTILIPPKNPGGVQFVGEEMDIEELKERLGAYVEEDKVYEL